MKLVSRFSFLVIRWPLLVLLLLLVSLLVAGCGGKKRAEVPLPAPPAAEPAEHGVPTPAPAEAPGAAPVEAPAAAKALYSETGLASWYGSPYHNRRAANGEIYDMHQQTAAHRTFPLNSIVRVTYLETGKATLVRINDRGPFIEGRIIDLSLAAAKEIGLWRAGVGKVKVELIDAPSPLDKGGRWCVQIGAFSDKDKAKKFKEKLEGRYRTASVLQFTGPTGDWLRVRVADDDRRRADEVLRDNQTPEGRMFLVRMD